MASLSPCRNGPTMSPVASTLNTSPPDSVTSRRKSAENSRFPSTLIAETWMPPAAARVAWAAAVAGRTARSRSTSVSMPSVTNTAAPPPRAPSVDSAMSTASKADV